jgi:hypothetical protein
MTIIEQQTQDQKQIEEMRDEIALLKASGCKQIVIDIDIAEQLVAVSLGVMQLSELDLLSLKPAKKVQR